MSTPPIAQWLASWQQLLSEPSPFALHTDARGLRSFARAPANLVEALQAGRVHGDKPFLLWQDQEYSFARFFEVADRLTAAFQQVLDVRPGQRVAIAMRNRPEWMLAFVAAAQAILYRGAGLDVVWPQFLAILAIGAVFFLVALGRFRKTITRMA